MLVIRHLRNYLPTISFTLHGSSSNCFFSCLIYHRNSLFRITLQVFLDRFVEREIQSLLVHCIHQEEGCDWKDELRKREVTTKLLYDVQISHDVYPLPALLTRGVPLGLICSRETREAKKKKHVF